LKYRDRARERRDDSNPDYQNVEQYDVVSVEKSKFLGGDIEHTHLVKGLDYALANKMREETEKREEERLEKEFMEKEKLKVQQQEIPKVEPEKKKKSSLQFLSPLGRSLYRVAIEHPATVGQPLEHFIPGRMTYEFDLDENFSSDIPTTVLQSKADLPHDDDRVTGMVDPSIRKKVDKIMRFLRQGTQGIKGKKKHKKKEEDGEGGEEGEPEDEDETLDEEIKRKAMTGADDDIFQTTEGEMESTTKPEITQKPKGPYFESSAPPSSEPKESKEVKEEPEEEEVEDEEDEDEPEEKQQAKPMEVEDYYECYPSFDGDDDSDEDLTKMDQGRGRSRLRPWDFATEEQWERYNHLKEATPKAAFQFGLKMKDGRKQKYSKARTPAEAERIKEKTEGTNFQQTMATNSANH